MCSLRLSTIANMYQCFFLILCFCVCAPSSEKCFDFRSKNVDFWCILGDIFCSSATYSTSKKHFFWAYKTCCCSLQAMHSADSKRRQTQACWKVEAFYKQPLVFPLPIVCSRLSNNINILAKKFFQAANGGGAWPLRPPGSATDRFHI